MISASEALERLKAGNERFVEEVRGGSTVQSRSGVDVLPEEQEPIAVVLGCSDARVPAISVFDQSLGDLFIISVAGNVVAPSQVGSIEFAVETFGTRLVVVMGHSHCGAVKATLDELERPAEEQSPNLRAIVDRIRPSVEGLMATNLREDREELMNQAVRANIRASVSHLKSGSAIIEKHLANDGLMVVGAEYSLKTGKVEFF